MIHPSATLKTIYFGFEKIKTALKLTFEVIQKVCNAKINQFYPPNPPFVMLRNADKIVSPPYVT